MKISVIIPTMWRPDFFENSLKELQKVTEVGEIIIISNDTPTFTPQGKKVRILQQEKNLGVNASWNLGVLEAKYDNLVFLNDDFAVESSFYKKALDNSSKYSLISINSDPNETQIKEILSMPYGFGCCFFMKKEDYKQVPEELFTYYGDCWQVLNCNLSNKKICLLPNVKTNKVLSLTSKEFLHTLKDEGKIFSDKRKTLHKYKFSIIIPHFDGTKTDEELESLLQNIEDQTFRDFEVLLYHDGPESRTPVDLSKYTYPITYKATESRYNDWGHTQRDMGIREASGEFIIHMNSDNVMYSQMLQKLYECSEDTALNGFCGTGIIIYPIYKCSVILNGLQLTTFKDRRNFIDRKVIYSGFPAMQNFIDAMQLVMLRELWISEGGWYDKSMASDGVMYQKFVRKHKAKYVGEVLGEHR